VRVGFGEERLTASLAGFAGAKIHQSTVGTSTTIHFVPPVWKVESFDAGEASAKGHNEYTKRATNRAIVLFFGVNLGGFTA